MAKAKRTETVAAAPVSAAPEFNLNADSLDYSDEAALEADLAKSGGKYFDEPGNVDLKIIAADFHKNKETGSIYCKGDDTWFNVKLTMQGAGDKEIDHWLQIPTSKIKFGTKGTLAVYKKLQQFFFGIGEEVTLNNLGKLVKKYFADPGAGLTGIAVNVDLGYEGPYVAKLPDSEDFAIYVKGTPLTEDGDIIRMPDRASAVQVAKGRNIQPSFVKVVKFIAKKGKATVTKINGKASTTASAATTEEW